jgi:hypothetical protein
MVYDPYSMTHHKENSFTSVEPQVPRNSELPLPDEFPMPELFGSNRVLLDADQPLLIIETYMWKDSGRPGEDVEKRVRLHQIGQFEARHEDLLWDLPFVESLEVVRAKVADSWGINLDEKPFELVYHGDSSTVEGHSTDAAPIIVDSDTDWSLLWHLFPAPPQESSFSNFDDATLAKPEFGQEKLPRKRFEIVFKEQKDGHPVGVGS